MCIIIRSVTQSEKNNYNRFVWFYCNVSLLVPYLKFVGVLLKQVTLVTLVTLATERHNSGKLHSSRSGKIHVTVLRIDSKQYNYLLTGGVLLNHENIVSSSSCMIHCHCILLQLNFHSFLHHILCVSLPLLQHVSLGERIINDFIVQTLLFVDHIECFVVSQRCQTHNKSSQSVYIVHIPFFSELGYD